MSEIYEKGAPLGRGPFATVYAGRDLSLDRPVAIKELTESFASIPAIAAAFVERARTMAGVKHAHLRTLHSIDTTHSAPWLITELADKTLRDAPAQGPMQPEQVDQLLRQVLPALAAIHAAGLTHGGIKPSNLFVCDRIFKLGDFGFTAAEAGLTLDELIPPRYTAPEELSFKGLRTAAEDLYSLGLVCYELLLGEEAFIREVWKIGGRSAGQDGEREEAGKRAGEFDHWLGFHTSPVNLPAPRAIDPRLPEDLSRVLERMIRKEPAARYSSCEAVLADLVGRRAPETPTLAVAVTPRRRRPLLYAALVGSLLLLLLAGGLLLRKPVPMATIDSKPPGAQVLFAGEPQGTTPMRLRLKVGATLTLRREGFRDAEVTQTAPPHKRLYAELLPSSVAVTSDPGGASVLVDGREVGVTPLDYAGETGAPLTFHKEGFVDQTVAPAKTQAALHVVLAPVPAPDPWSNPQVANPAALAAELLKLRGGEGLALSFDPPATIGPRVPLDTVLRFRAVSARAATLALFALSSDGTIFCVYPSGRRTAVPLQAGAEIGLPLPEDERAGLLIQASEPLGPDLVFALALTSPVPPPPAGDGSKPWLTTYPFVAGPENPALAFAMWVAEARKQKDSALAILEMEVVTP